MNKFVMTVAAASVAFAGAAQAATISISVFDISEFDSAVGYNDFVIQDFENHAGFTMGEDKHALALTNGAGSGGMIDGSSLNTNVGTFSSLGGTGTGGVCNESLGTSSGGECNNLYLKNTETFGQGNMVPDDGEWSLNSNDTYGIVWDVVKSEGGSLFNRVVFGLMDAGDTGAIVGVDLDGGIEEYLNRDGGGNYIKLDNANQKLIVIDFAGLRESAKITIGSYSYENGELVLKTNDGKSIDGASVGVVPLPAGGLLLLTGLGALALRRRRKAA